MPNACLDCTDNRFEIIADYKKRLIESTNIESSPDEMAVIDSVLYRIWQMGWIPATVAEPVVRCRECKFTNYDGLGAIYCPKWDRWQMPPDAYCYLGEKRKNGKESE